MSDELLPDCWLILNIMRKSGQILVAAALALEYGFTDIDGKQPRPLTLETA